MTFKRGESDTILEEYQKKSSVLPPLNVEQGETILPTSSKLPSFNFPPKNTRVDPQAKYPSKSQLIRESHMQPKRDIVFRVDVPDLDDVMLMMLGASRCGFLTQIEWDAVKCIDSGYSKLVNMAERVRNIDFSPLREPRLDYADQKSIQNDRVDMAATFLLHYGGELGTLV
jgi:hypothetical protein